MEELYTLIEYTRRRHAHVSAGFLSDGFIASYLEVILIFFGRADSALGSLSVNTPSVIFAST